MTKLTVTAKGQVTLRKDLLQHLGVEQDQRIELTELPGGRIEFRAERAAGTIDSFVGLLADKARNAATIEEINEAAAKDWAAQE